MRLPHGRVFKFLRDYFPAVGAKASAQNPVPTIGPDINITFPAFPWIPRAIQSTPAVGVEISHLVPDGFQWIVLGVFLQLTTDATVPVRTVTLRLRDTAPGVWWAHTAVATQAASLIRSYEYTPLALEWAAFRNTVILADVPADFILDEGWNVNTLTTNLAAGDQYTRGDVLVLERRKIDRAGI